MIRYVHQSPKFVKHLAALGNGGKQTAIIAQKAESILRLLLNQGYILPDQLGATNRYMDRRIRNCTKYDLGGGYRLITVKESEHLFILYIGPHDDCCRWIANNKELVLRFVKNRCTTYAITDTETRHKNTFSVSAYRQDDPEEDLPKGLEDKELRQIFCGITKETA
jgi:hypothetical protein